jgi:Protein of unknown function (DUF2975)
MKGVPMTRGSTIILRGVIILIGLVVLVMCVGIAFLITDGKENYRTPIWAGLYVAAVPFYIALYQTLKLLNYIDRNTVFSELSVKALKNIKYCALAISGLFVAGSPYIMHVAQTDDAPGLFAMALLIIGTSFVIATSAGVLQKLLQSAIDIKSENDLTV